MEFGSISHNSLSINIGTLLDYGFSKGLGLFGGSLARYLILEGICNPCFGMDIVLLGLENSYDVMTWWWRCMILKACILLLRYPGLGNCHMVVQQRLLWRVELPMLICKLAYGSAKVHESRIAIVIIKMASLDMAFIGMRLIHTRNKPSNHGSSFHFHIFVLHLVVVHDCQLSFTENILRRHSLIRQIVSTEKHGLISVTGKM